MASTPNILLLFTDQQRGDTIGALGHPVIRTPHLDHLTREGVAFTRCYTPSPVCVAGRCSLLTGQPPHVTGCLANTPMPEPDVMPSLMDHLSSRGYQTHGVGKMHFTPDFYAMRGFESRDISEEIPDPDGRDGFRQQLRDNGYDHVADVHGLRSEMYYVPQPSQLPAHLHGTAWTADRSINFLENRDTSRPFFLWSSFIKPHPPFEVPTPWNRLYRATEVDPPFIPPGYEDLLTYWNRNQNRYKYRDRGLDGFLLRCMRAYYYACISFIDYHVGRILDALGSDIDNTLVLFSSDHGELLGDYGSFGKRSMHDAAARVPLIARFPGGEHAGERCDEVTSLLDIYPTCLAAAGHDSPSVNDEGRNLAGVAAGRADREFVFSQYDGHGKGLYMAASKSHKYVHSEPDQRDWLFDLEADPHETADRSTDRACAAARDRLKRTLIDRFKRDGHTEPLDADDWRQYPVLTVSDDPDGELIRQDPAALKSMFEAMIPDSYKN
ncbi:MAG: sulfatase-like hydrolase/transferase [Phycisphaeraceae bacterium]